MAAFALDDYDYHLPPELIAQQPAPRRDASRLLVCDGRHDFALADRRFPGVLDLLAPGDLLVFNDTRVFPARLPGRKESGGRIELLLLEYPQPAGPSAAGSTAPAEEGRGTAVSDHGVNGVSGHGVPQVAASETAMPASVLEPARSPQDAVPRDRLRAADSAGARVFSEPCRGLLKSSKGPRVGGWLYFGPDFRAEVLTVEEGGKVRVRLELDAPGGTTDPVTNHRVCPVSDQGVSDISAGADPAAWLADALARYGRMPLPPYIKRNEENEEDRRRYQTVYAQAPGAVAAPTAGLHFTDELLAQIKEKGVGLARITLHVGYGTFAPVRSQDIREHDIHAEDYRVSRESAELINRTRAAGGRIWAVGTTSVRTLEAAADQDGWVSPGGGSCRLYIYPGYSFKVVDNLLTNFHLPRSSLLFLVSALAGRENILRAYAHAVEQRYRFFSYGDAMAIIRR